MLSIPVHRDVSSEDKDCLFLDIVRNLLNADLVFETFPFYERPRFRVSPVRPYDFSLITLTVTGIVGEAHYEGLFAKFCAKIDENMEDATQADDTSTLIMHESSRRLIRERNYTVIRLNYTTFNARKDCYPGFAPCILQGFAVEEPGTRRRCYQLQVILQRFQSLPAEHLLAILMSQSPRLGTNSGISAVPQEVLTNRILGQSLGHVKTLYRSTNETDVMSDLFDYYLSESDVEKINRLFTGSALDNDPLTYHADKLLKFQVPQTDRLAQQLMNGGGDNEMITEFRTFMTPSSDNKSFHVTLPLVGGSGIAVSFQLDFSYFAPEFCTFSFIIIDVRGIGFPENHEFNEDPLNALEYFIKKCLYFKRFTKHDFVDRVHPSSG